VQPKNIFINSTLCLCSSWLTFTGMGSLGLSSVGTLKSINLFISHPLSFLA
jgi:hypothetical protein